MILIVLAVAVASLISVNAFINIEEGVVESDTIDAVKIRGEMFNCDCITSDNVCPEWFSSKKCTTGDIDCNPSNCE